MNSKQLESLVDAFKAVDGESLNGDPMYFNGKIVLPLEEDKILKIMGQFTFNGDNDIITRAQEQGIEFYAPLNLIYGGTICFVTQDKLELREIPLIFNVHPLINSWGSVSNKEENAIAEAIIESYGEEEFQKIVEFNKTYHIGNVAWRNIGFDEEGKIKCFDFFCGLARDGEGHIRRK